MALHRAAKRLVSPVVRRDVMGIRLPRRLLSYPLLEDGNEQPQPEYDKSLGLHGMRTWSLLSTLQRCTRRNAPKDIQ